MKLLEGTKGQDARMGAKQRGTKVKRRGAKEKVASFWGRWSHSGHDTDAHEAGKDKTLHMQGERNKYDEQDKKN